MKSIRQAVSDALFLSLTSDQIRKVVEEVDNDFDLYRVSGFGPNIRIPTRVAVECAMDNFPDEKTLLNFVAYLIKNEGRSVGGTPIHLRSKADLLARLEYDSWIYHADLGHFVKDQSVRATLDWGFMMEGSEYPLTFASVDLVGSSTLAERVPGNVVEQTLISFREYIRTYVEMWNGRLWTWTGDGGLCVFQGSDSVNRGVIAMTICLLNLPVFSLRKSKIPDDVGLKMRVGIHHGLAAYHKDVRSIFSTDIRFSVEMEQKACPVNGVVLSDTARSMLRSEVAANFVPHAMLDHVQLWRFVRAHGG